jgi:Secretion system C-terminal sorting domain
MKKQLLFILSFLFLQYCHAQCPSIKGIFINACGVVTSGEEGLNEFMVIKNGTTPTLASDIIIKIPATNGGSPNTNTLAFDTKANATILITNFDGVITNPSCKSTGATPILVPLGATDNIPANADVIVFTGGKFETYPYNFNSYCGQTLYVLLNLKTVTPTGGAFANSGPRTSTIATTGCNAGAIKSYTYATPANAAVPSGSPANAGAGDGDYFSFTSPDSPTLLPGNSGAGTSGGSASNNGCGIPPPSIVLPINNITINATANKTFNTINWQTGLEVNVHKFIVEKSTDDAVSFLEIGNLTAKGNNATYSYNDAAMQKTKTYYRIQIVDIDGKKTYSSIVNIINENSITFICYPKLASNIINLQWEATENKSTVVTLIDNIGRVLLIKKLNSIIGYNKTTINIDALSRGQYFIRMNNGSDKITESFIKQ